MLVLTEHKTYFKKLGNFCATTKFFVGPVTYYARAGYRHVVIYARGGVVGKYIDRWLRLTALGLASNNEKPKNCGTDFSTS